MMQYLLVSIAAFLGVFCGFTIACMAEEELKLGRKYFNWLRHGLFVVILAIFFYHNQSVIFFMFVPAIIIVMSFSKEREALYYYALAPIMFLSYLYNGFLSIATLVFLYGFPVGTLHREAHLKEHWKKSVKGIIYAYGGFFILNIAFSALQLSL
ncbi:hypothetical protein JW826_03520 [Candidatus Woesearchaeota archaeon]|nr:hypothetical protein [Candidatus Woesearchaeota archaeon]